MGDEVTVMRRPARAADALIEALLHATDRPLSTYDMRDRLGAQGERVSIPLVYRAVERLLEAGTIRRVESRNGYVIAPQGGSALAICPECARTTPVDIGPLASQIATLARHQHLVVKEVVIEIHARCPSCPLNEAGNKRRPSTTW
jgi:Fe2+ or Zn2+ uptake regulation protein